MPHLLYPYKTSLMAGTVGDPSAVINWDFLQSQSLTSFSRTSNATMFDSTGKLTYAPNNLLTYSNTFSNAAWTKDNVTPSSGVADPVGGTNAWTVTASAPACSIYQSVSISNASSCRGLNTVWLRRRTGSGTVRLYAPNGATFVVAALTSSWQQFAVSSVGHVSGVFYIFVELLTSGDAVDVYAPTVSRVTYETTPRSGDQVITTTDPYYGPRYPYAYNGSTWDAQGLLVEAAGTNLVTYSGDLSNAAWFTKSAGTSGTKVTAPDGTTSAAPLVPVAALDTHRVYQTATSVNGSTYTMSVYVKPNGYTKFALVENAITGFEVAYDATGNGSVLYSNSASGTITNVGNGWYRITHTSVAGGTLFRLDLFVLPASYTTGSVIGTWTPDGTSGAYVWGAQVEAGSTATSYIPNLATGTTTRNGEVIQITGTALTTLQGSAGTLVIEQQGCTGYLLSASAANNVPLYYGSSTTAKTNNNSNQSLTATFGSSTFASATKIGVAWDGSGRSLCAVNGTVATDANAFATLTNAYIGSDGSANFANSYIRRIRIWDQRLSDAALKRQTT